MNQAVAGMPENADAWYAQGRCLLHLGKQEEAEQALRKSQQLDPADTKAIYALGRLLSETGRKEEANLLFAKALALNAENRAAKPGEIKFKSFHSRNPR